MNPRNIFNRDLLKELKVSECRDATFGGWQHPIVLDRAQGAEIWDVEGNRYIDLCAGFGSLPLGHNDSRIVSEVFGSKANGVAPKIMQGLGDLYPSLAKIELIRSLKDLIPQSLSKIGLALTGSQAVEFAIKTAVQSTGKSGFISCVNGYHGVEIGSLPLTSSQIFRAPFEKLLASTQVERVSFGASESDLLKAVERLEAGGGFSGLIVEPVQGRGGIIPAKLEWLRTLRKICDKFGAVLIFDEIFTGMGRIGTISTAFEVLPDISCFGKALGGGMPLSAIAGTEKVMNGWPESRGEAIHTGTFFGHPLSCAVASVTIKAIIDDDLVARSNSLGDWAKDYLSENLETRLPKISIRGQGLMIGVELENPGSAIGVVENLVKNGVIAIPSGPKGNVVSITPSLNIPQDLFEKALKLVTDAVIEIGSA